MLSHRNVTISPRQESLSPLSPASAGGEKTQIKTSSVQLTIKSFDPNETAGQTLPMVSSQEDREVAHTGPEAPAAPRAEGSRKSLQATSRTLSLSMENAFAECCLSSGYILKYFPSFSLQVIVATSAKAHQMFCSRPGGSALSYMNQEQRRKQAPCPILTKYPSLFPAPHPTDAPPLPLSLGPGSGQ